MNQMIRSFDPEFAEKCLVFLTLGSWKITGIFLSSENLEMMFLQTQKNQHFISFGSEFEEKCLRSLTIC